MAGHAGAISAAWSGRMLAPGEGGQDLCRRLGSLVNSESRVRTCGTLRGDRVTHSTTGTVQTLSNVSSAKPNAFKAAAESH